MRLVVVGAGGVVVVVDDDDGDCWCPLSSGTRVPDVGRL